MSECENCRERRERVAAWMKRLMQQAARPEFARLPWEKQQEEDHERLGISHPPLHRD